MPNSRRSTTRTGLRSALLKRAIDERGPLVERYAALSGDSSRLAAHDALIRALESDAPARVSAQDLADAFTEMGAPSYDLAEMGGEYEIAADGEIIPL